MALSKQTRSNLNILLLGKTGNGKSSTGNSILMRGQVFEVSSGFSSETKTGSTDFVEFNGFYIKVVDTPGIGDTCLSEEESYQIVSNTVSEVLTCSPEGYHAILIVLKCGNRYTKEEQQSIRALMKILGDDFIKNHGIVLITNKDQFKNQECFDAFIASEKEKSELFREILSLCQDRIIFFNNKLSPADKDKPKKKMKKMEMLRDQNKKLIDLIVNKNLHENPYTNDHFKNAQYERDKLLLETKAPMFREEMKKKTAFILEKIKSFTYSAIDKREKILEEARREQEHLQDQIKEEAKGTDALAEAEAIVSDLGEIIQREFSMIEVAKCWEDTLFELQENFEKEKTERIREFKQIIEEKNKEFEAKNAEREKEFEIKFSEAQKDSETKMQQRYYKMEAKRAQDKREHEKTIETLKDDFEKKMEEKEQNFQDMKSEKENEYTNIIKELTEKIAYLEKQYQEYKHKLENSGVISSLRHVLKSIFAKLI